MLTRWHRQRGERTWYPDRHRRARPEGPAHRRGERRDPAGVGDQLVETAWLPVLETIDVANDDFIRTTDARHTTAGAGVLAAVCDDTGEVYEGSTRGRTAWAARSSSSSPSDLEASTAATVVEGVRDPPAPGRDRSARTTTSSACREYAERLLDALRGAPRVRAAGVGAQRGGLVRPAGPAGPLDLALDVRLGHPGAVGRSRTSSTSGSTRCSTTPRARRPDGTDQRARSTDLARRRPPRRQGHPALPRGHLAGDADGRRRRRCRSRSSRTAGCSSAARR